VSEITPRKSTVPGPITLLGIQTAGAVLALLPIVSLNRFAKLTIELHHTLIVAAVANTVLSAFMLFGFLFGLRVLIGVIGRIGELGFCRVFIIYDMLMLGLLVYLTGGSDQSVFAPQAAAVLPMAVLIKDSPALKWTYAAIFLLMFLLGLQDMPDFQGYLPDSQYKERWFLVFFFIFTLFPIIYSIETDRTP
jgi:hypothetical protein